MGVMKGGSRGARPLYRPLCVGRTGDSGHSSRAIPKKKKMQRGDGELIHGLLKTAPQYLPSVKRGKTTVVLEASSAQSNMHA